VVLPTPACRSGAGSWARRARPPPARRRAVGASPPPDLPTPPAFRPDGPGARVTPSVSTPYGLLCRNRRGGSTMRVEPGQAATSSRPHFSKILINSHLGRSGRYTVAACLQSGGGGAEPERQWEVGDWLICGGRRAIPARWKSRPPGPSRGARSAASRGPPAER